MRVTPAKELLGLVLTIGLGVLITVLTDPEWAGYMLGLVIILPLYVVTARRIRATESPVQESRTTQVTGLVVWGALFLGSLALILVMGFDAIPLIVVTAVMFFARPYRWLRRRLFRR